MTRYNLKNLLLELFSSFLSLVARRKLFSRKSSGRPTDSLRGPLDQKRIGKGSPSEGL